MKNTYTKTRGSLAKIIAGETDRPTLPTRETMRVCEKVAAKLNAMIDEDRSALFRVSLRKIKEHSCDRIARLRALAIQRGEYRQLHPTGDKPIARHA